MDYRDEAEQFETVRKQYDEVINNLTLRFGGIINWDVISDVVEHCNGDLLASTAAILSIVGDDDAPPDMPITTSDLNFNQPITDTTAILQPQQSMSYANIANTTGAVPRTVTNKQTSPRTTIQHPPQIKNIIKSHKQGYCILILMRGVPGSGKSYLARQIVDATVGPGESNYKTHIASTDDFFSLGGRYHYDRDKISDAHDWNQRRVNAMLRRGVSPIIIDNTNVKIWEMAPYVRCGVEESYIVEIVQASSPWARDPIKCFKNCQHDVPYHKIKRMRDNFEYYDIAGEKLLRIFNYVYPPNKWPPVVRKEPPFIESLSLSGPPPQTEIRLINNEDPMLLMDDIQTNQDNHAISSQADRTEAVKTKLNQTSDTDLLNNMDHNYTNIVKQLEEFEEIEKAWESGDNWTESSKSPKPKPVNETTVFTAPMPPRRQISSSDQPTESASNAIPNTNPFQTTDEFQDWRCYTQYLPPWNDQATSAAKVPPPIISVVTRDSTTSVEIGDTEFPSKKNYKVLNGTPKDINFYYIPKDEKIPDKRMLDKSSMTNEQMIMDSHRCSNEHKHFKAFRKMFRNVSKSDLWEIFDKCQGDVNWAVEIVLDGVSSQTIDTVDEDIESDDDESSQEHCPCSAAYDIIPDVKENVKAEVTTANTVSTPQLLLPNKAKKEKVVSENSKQLKRQIENNVVLADNHYSPHVLKIKNLRNGEMPSTSSQGSEPLPNGFDGSKPGTSKDFEKDESEDGSSESDCYEEETVNVTLGFDFIKKLDTLFDREGLNYTENILPTICMPLSTLREINALWMESLTNQLDGQAELANVIMKQDEDFARELAEKEDELERTGVEPPIPDLKEIMDMEYAMSVFRKDLIGQKGQASPTLAEMMSRNKLHAMFPDISQDALTDMLLAHDNNFKNTVEVVLMSLGRTDILETETGVERFIAQKEMDQHLERLEVEKQKQLDSEKDYPLLPNLDELEISMESVQKYRAIADEILKERDTNFQKAQNYMSRGMTTTASYYSSLANMHTKKCQLVNNMAAAVLIQVHKKNNNDMTLDLHHLRVIEALQALDMFIDFHLKKLRDDSKKGIYNIVTLYIITGRGAHSVDGPKVRPAVRRRLTKRGFRTVMLNPGVCSINICCDNKMTHQL